ncbi:AAA family ATPase [Maridesulfovibrio sp.]|uniref:AAA family ATPase n=1 Tax=Maridesulfovibrio sp. TaxID=2795000 RepID=UPI003B00F55B
MRINKLKLENYRLFKDVELDFSKESPGDTNVIVFIGNNGAGKTTILEALSLNLSWLVARIKRERASGSAMKDLAIANGENFSVVTTDAVYSQTPYQWTLAKTMKGKKKTVESNLKGLTELAELFRDNYTKDENASLPLLAYYPVERTILDIPLKIRTKHSFGQLDGLDGSLQTGVDFRRFFEWFREREDSESEVLARDVLPTMITKIQHDYDSIPPDNLDVLFNNVKTSLKDKQLNAVRNAIEALMPGFENLRIERKPRLRMMVDKDNSQLDVEQLSQGEKSLMALVGSIASRLSMMNPALAEPLEGRGIIMIDEVDLHLHPRWQQGIIDRLRSVFPNCQFILTTHSPLVISNSQNILAYMLEDGDIRQLGNLYGMDANQVLLQEMGVGIRNQDVQDKLDDVLDLIHDREFPEAHAEIKELEKELPTDHWELNKIKILLMRKEAQFAKNN